MPNQIFPSGDYDFRFSLGSTFPETWHRPDGPFLVNVLGHESYQISEAVVSIMSSGDILYRPQGYGGFDDKKAWW